MTLLIHLQYTNMTVLEADVSTIILTDLHPNFNTPYIVSISALTSAGCGPFTQVINETDEDSKYDQTCLT